MTLAMKSRAYHAQITLKCTQLLTMYIMSFGDVICSLVQTDEQLSNWCIHKSKGILTLPNPMCTKSYRLQTVCHIKSARLGQPSMFILDKHTVLGPQSGTCHNFQGNLQCNTPTRCMRCHKSTRNTCISCTVCAHEM